MFRQQLVTSLICRSISHSLPVFPDLLSAIPTGLHVTVIFFCGAVVLFSSVATGFFFFNAFGRPYETLRGPMGLYLWTFITCENQNTLLHLKIGFTLSASGNKLFFLL